MRWFYFIVVLICISCTKEDLEVYSNLEEYISLQNNIDQIDVIACAASDRLDSEKTFIFFYPVIGASDIKYFETKNTEADKNDFSLYTEVNLRKEPVFNGYLERFVRESDVEVWCVVTYEVNGVLRTAQPIRLKHQTKFTEWIESVSIDNSDVLQPIFSWNDGNIDENEIYFQVLSDARNNLLSGTYTYDRWFQYYNLQNVVLNVTRETPPDLMLNNNYNFTLMAVSIDNWVNLVIQKEFFVSSIE